MRLAHLALITALSVAAAACGSDKKAPPAPAPSGTQPAAPGGALPSGHPPVDQAPQGHPPMSGMPGQMPGQAPGAASGAGTVFTGEAPATSPIVWDVPAGWVATRPTNNMRVANFPLGEADGQVVEVVVFSLGGTAQQNVQRWIGFFADDAGDAGDADATEAEPAEIREFDVNGLRVTRLDVTGTFAGSGMGGADSTHTGVSNYRLLAVVVEGGKAPLQVKLAGPAALVAEHASEFDAFVQSIRPRE